ncbi:MAG: alpha/beta hydrolase [Clostridia bacterium]|nr:alpha/beta hydrolase [Clostridia bacterium]
MATAQTKRRVLLRVLIPVLAAALLCAAVFGYLLTGRYGADTAAVASFSVAVPECASEGNYYYGVGSEEIGLIFYPGAKVDPVSYAPLMRAIASEGVFCALCAMPFDLAVFGQSRADAVQKAYPEVGSWYLAGHSLGGVMAARQLSARTDRFQGLILFASYVDRDLSALPLRVLSLYGSEDKVLDRARYEKNKAYLPASFEERVIEGGCHAGFGFYGPQQGDGEPSLSPEEQVRAAAALTVAFLEGQ